MAVTNYRFVEEGSSNLTSINRLHGFTTSSSSKRNKVVTAQSRNSVTTPGYREIVADGRLPPDNPYNFSLRVDRYPSGYTELNTGGPFQDGRYYYTDKRSGMVDPIDHGQPNVTGATSAELAALDRKVINDLLLKIKDQKVNLAQAAAERAKTAQTIGDAAIRLAKAMGALKKGNLAKAADALGIKGFTPKPPGRNHPSQSLSVARGWLELQYGWRPLLNDVYGAAEAIAKAHHYPPVEKVVKNKSISTSRSIAVKDTASALPRFSYVDHESSVTTVRYVCSFAAGTQPLKTLSELGITNPMLIAWELMPWSFVIDWFLPIGDYISALDATLGLQFRTGTKTVFLKGNTSRSITYGPHTGYGGTLAGYAVCSTEQVSVSRTVLTRFPAVHFPNFKNPLSYEHLANGMALLRAQKRS